jgi:MFS family permease
MCSAAALSAFPMVRSIVTLLIYLLVAPRVKLSRVRRPLLAGIAAKGLGLILLLALAPWRQAALWIAGLSAACDAFALAMLGPVMDALMAVSIPADDRARVNSVLVAGFLLVSAPVTWLAGRLSEESRALPLILCLGLVALEIAVALSIDRTSRREAKY